MGRGASWGFGPSRGVRRDYGIQVSHIQWGLFFPKLHTVSSMYVNRVEQSNRLYILSLIMRFAILRVGIYFLFYVLA